LCAIDGACVAGSVRAILLSAYAERASAPSIMSMVLAVP
jgi:hypothetical protein